MGELVFFDVETTMPTGAQSRCWMLEFGAILVCPRKLVEIGSYSTLIKPADLSVVSPHRISGITREAVSSAPPFEDVADQIYKIMHGRVWVGHNIRRFDCPRLKEAFADIGRPAPEPIGTIDSLNVLSQGFGRRAGDLKMATLASYFKIGQQKHRSLDDARMNLEVIKHCATVLFLESSLPNILFTNNTGMVTRSKATATLTCRQEISRKSKLGQPQPAHSIQFQVSSFQLEIKKKTKKEARNQTKLAMMNPISSWIFLILSLTAVLPVPNLAIESPQYTVLHTESGFQIRLYHATAWISAPSYKKSFQQATKHGFHRLFQYIQGANLNSTRLWMTKPVVTSVIPGSQALSSSAYYARFYLQAKFQDSPPVPLPELDIVSDNWAPHCVAVREFSGFARDGNVAKEAEKLALSLSNSLWAINKTDFNSTGGAYSIAQYDSPFKLFGRVNEVWIDVVGSEETGCRSGGIVEVY